jgi:uncharacterized protein
VTFVLIAIVGALMVVVGSTALVWWQQERIVFQPPRNFPPTDRVDAPRLVSYRASDGQQLHGYFIRPEATPRGTLLAFHGNADLAVWQVPWAEELARRTRFQVFLAEYRGYAGIPGAPTYPLARLDAHAAYEFVRDKRADTGRHFVIFGHSLGSAIAAELASEVKPDVLVLQSPFTSARAMAARIVLPPALLAWRLISRVHYDTERRVAELSTPVWVSHGDRDLVVPIRMGRAVYAAAKVKGELLIAPGAGHNDVEAVGGERYWDWITRALGQ